MPDHLPPPPPEQSHTNPYAPPTTQVEAASEVFGRPPLARRLARFAAKFCDNLLISGAFFGLIALGGVFGGAKGQELILVSFFALAFLWIAIIAGINSWLIHTRGQTIGKLACKIKILRSDYSRVSLGRVFSLRFLVPTVISAVPLIGPLFSLVDACLIFGEPRRCIHDYMADTIVVDIS